MQQLPDTPVTDQSKREDTPNAGADNAKSSKQQKLTKRELLELADYLYSRYEYKKNNLPKDSERAIIETGTNRDKSKRK